MYAYPPVCITNLFGGTLLVIQGAILKLKVLFAFSPKVVVCFVLALTVIFLFKGAITKDFYSFVGCFDSLREGESPIYTLGTRD